MWGSTVFFFVSFPGRTGKRSAIFTQARGYNYAITEFRNSSWLRIGVLAIFKESYGVPFTVICRPYLLGRVSLFYFAGHLALFWLDFLCTEPLCLHLPFAKWWSLPHMPLLMASESYVFFCWRSWGKYHRDFLIYRRFKKIFRALDCKARLCWVVFPCLETRNIFSFEFRVSGGLLNSRLLTILSTCS